MTNYCVFLLIQPPSKFPNPTHAGLVEVLDQIFPETTPRVLAFGENHPNCKSSEVQSVSEHVAEEVIPWLRRKGFKTMVTEVLFFGTPQEELQRYYETGIINKDKTPYLYKSYSSIKDPRGLLALLKSAKDNDITLVGGGISLEELEMDLNASTGAWVLLASVWVYRNLLGATSDQLSSEGKVAIHSGALHNDINGLFCESIFSPEGLRQLQLTADNVAEIDIIVPEFTTASVAKEIAALSPSEGVFYQRNHGSHVVAYAWAQSSMRYASSAPLTD